MTNGAAVKIGLAGIAGYGDLYLEALLPKLETLGAKLVGVVDPMPQRCRRMEELHRAHVPIHSSIEQLFEGSDALDLMLIVTPIHLHPEQTIYSLQRGANVLCEKPLAGTLPDALRMLEVQATSKNFAAIGFQWSFSHAVQSLKRDIMEGVLGRPIRMKSLVFFPRPITYFSRNDWAGRKHSLDGRGVFDSPVNNAAAHYLHNMFYLLGGTRETSEEPATVQAELYRANAVENYDTAAIRAITENGVEVLFYTSHAVGERRGPKSRYEFENAVVEYDAAGSGEFVARFKDGRVKHYGHPNLDRHEKIWQSISSVRSGKPVACGIAASIPHALCVAAAQESGGEIVDFPQRLRRTVSLDDEAMIAIDSLGEQLADCYERNCLPAEHKTSPIAWARMGRVIEVREQHVNGKKNGAGRRPEVSVTVSAAVTGAAAAAGGKSPWPSSVELQ